MTTTIMLTNWNGTDRLRECLPSVMAARARHPDIIGEVLVVDDASSDDSVEFLRKNFPDVRVVRNDVNLGFIGTTNRGVQEARGEFVVLLNNDVKVTEDFLVPVMPHFSNPRVFAVSFQALMDDEKTFREGGKSVRFTLGFPHIRHAARHQAGGTSPSIYAVGGHCAVRRDMYLKLEGMDSLYHPLYWDDMDISWRAWKNGWTVLYEPRSVVYHKEKGTMKSTLKEFTIKKIRTRNRMLFVWKNIHSPLLIASHVIFLFLRLLTSVFSSQRYYYPAFAEAVGRLPQALAARRREKAKGGESDWTVLRVGWPRS